MIPGAVVFDLFGTLLEFDALRSAAARVSTTPEAFVDAWRDKLVGYAFAAATIGRYEDFDRLTRHALHFTAARFGVRIVRDDLDALLGAWQVLGAYDDALPALQALRERGIPTAVLTNGTRSTARAALEHANASALIDVLLSVEAVGTFKPDPAAYRIATRHFSLAPERIAFVTAGGWDATGAREYGMSVVWCNRDGAPAEPFGPPPNATITTLNELPRAIEGIAD